jgi:hypothetical protein
VSTLSRSPLLSYIVLSYNHQQYVATTIRSILDQTVQDFEVVIVDDASRDDSVGVIRSFSDPRVRLLVNDRNLGGAGSYNRAVGAARGEWLVNLDSDDWIAPQKAERQLEAISADPRVDIVGTYVSFRDAHGEPQPTMAGWEAFINKPHELDLPSTWVGVNPLARSSTMVRHSTHLRIGLDDPTMVCAPDYELWTRALREHCRFLVVPEQLTFVRTQPGSVTHADAQRNMFEMSYAMLRNLVPLCEARTLDQTLVSVVAWIVGHPQLNSLTPQEVHRLLGTLMMSSNLDSYGAFRAALSSEEEDPTCSLVGRRCLVLTAEKTTRADLQRLEEGKSWHEQQARNWHEAFEHTAAAARWYQQQADNWHDAYERAVQSWQEAHRALADETATLRQTVCAQAARLARFEHLLAPLLTVRRVIRNVFGRGH